MLVRMPFMHLTSVLVADYDAAITFFVDALGFELVEDTPLPSNREIPKRWVVVRPAGAQTGILLALPDGPEQQAALGNQLGGRVGHFLQVESFTEAHARMLAAGVTFDETPRDEPWGMVAVFRDISGNPWDLIGPA